MAGTTPRRIDRRRIKELTEREEARLNERTPRSHTMYERAHNVLSGGVASSYYNGNPLGMAAARASLTEILTPEAYATSTESATASSPLHGRHREYDLPGYAIGVGSKGCVTFSPQKIVDYETFKETQDAELADLAWLFNMNRGIFMTPGREQEWTLSVTHTEESIDRYVAVFEAMAGDLPS